jgi:pimeloyl-ACP methyl ester carboxylesterase
LQSLGFRDGFLNRLVVEDLLGGTPAEVPERYDAASPADLPPFGIPQVLLDGTADDIAPFGITESYVRKAQALGDDATLVRIEGAGHFDPLDPDSSAFRYVCDAVLNLVGQQVGEY